MIRESRKNREVRVILKQKGETVVAESEKVLGGMAKEVLCKHEGRWDDAAVKEMLRMVRKDPIALEEALRYACQQALYLAGRKHRVYARNEAEREGSMPRTYTKEDREGARAAGDEWLLNMVISDGRTKFRDATKEMILKEAENYYRLYRGNQKEYHYHKEVAEAMSEGQTVGRAWTEKGLRELRGRLACLDGKHC